MNSIFHSLKNNFISVFRILYGERLTGFLVKNLCKVTNFCDLLQRRIQNPVQHLEWIVLQEIVNDISYFHKALHLRYLTRFRIDLCPGKCF